MLQPRRLAQARQLAVSEMAYEKALTPSDMCSLLPSQFTDDFAKKILQGLSNMISAKVKEHFETEGCTVIMDVEDAPGSAHPNYALIPETFRGLEAFRHGNADICTAQAAASTTWDLWQLENEKLRLRDLALAQANPSVEVDRCYPFMIRGKVEPESYACLD